MKVKKREVFNRGEYGYFVVAKETSPKVYAGLYNEDHTKVYLLSKNEFVDVYEVVDLLKSEKGVNGVKIVANINKRGKGIPKPKSFIGSKFDIFYYCTDTVSYKGISMCEIISYYNNNKFIDSVYGQNKYPSFACSVRMLLNNERDINKNIEKFIENNTEIEK